MEEELKDQSGNWVTARDPLTGMIYQYKNYKHRPMTEQSKSMWRTLARLPKIAHMFDKLKDITKYIDDEVKKNGNGLPF